MGKVGVSQAMVDQQDGCRTLSIQCPPPPWLHIFSVSAFCCFWPGHCGSSQFGRTYLSQASGSLSYPFPTGLWQLPSPWEGEIPYPGLPAHVLKLQEPRADPPGLPTPSLRIVIFRCTVHNWTPKRLQRMPSCSSCSPSQRRAVASVSPWDLG